MIGKGERERECVCVQGAGTSAAMRLQQVKQGAAARGSSVLNRGGVGGGMGHSPCLWSGVDGAWAHRVVLVGARRHTHAMPTSEASVIPSLPRRPHPHARAHQADLMESDMSSSGGGASSESEPESSGNSCTPPQPGTDRRTTCCKVR